MEKSMIKGFWQTTTLVCANHSGTEEVIMELQQGPKTLFYACPKCNPENRSEGECACNNRITLKEFEGMLNQIFTVLEKADENSTVLNLTNYTWKKRMLEFKVLEHTAKEMKIQVLNRKVSI
ncbi:MAG: hypothetical protein LBI03_02040 [Clostridiales bacterium]|jgi:hypothetical protein|nr:hypothetical protein [Clostridiales bacterium]